MPFWPVKKNVPQSLTPTELRDELLVSAGNNRELAAVCNRYKDQVADNLNVIGKIPDEWPKDDESLDKYFRALFAVAQCLANQCNAPELLNKLQGNLNDDNPLVKWERWLSDVPERANRLEYDELIEEVNEFIERAKHLGGSFARQHEAVVYGRLGELLFHSGSVSESLQAFQSAYDLCVEIDDIEGQFAYLHNLLKSHRHLGDGLAVRQAEQILELTQKNNMPVEAIQKRIEQLRTGEPLCRIICVREEQVFELDDIKHFEDGGYQFIFCRNRPSLQKALTLTDQGKQLASSGQFAEAIEKFHEASDVDPYDPDPHYQLGNCLLELGAYGKARESFEEVERLAPGWFRCRTDRWLAEGLELGRISNEQVAAVRVLEDGGLDLEQAASITTQALDRFPNFAPLYLVQGDLCKARDDKDGAIAAYRRGLELVEEPDLESRLLCGLAAALPKVSDEKRELLDRAINLDGSLVAIATARLIKLAAE